MNGSDEFRIEHLHKVCEAMAMQMKKQSELDRLKEENAMLRLELEKCRKKDKKWSLTTGDQE